MKKVILSILAFLALLNMSAVLADQVYLPSAPPNLTTGSSNTYLGVNAGTHSGAGTSNLGFGVGALHTNVTGTDDTALGYNALNKATGNYNTALGSGSLSSLENGANCVAVGYNALAANTANENTALGSNAGAVISTGQFNLACGAFALDFNQTGSYNTAVGHSSLTVSTGGACTAVGYRAGRQVSSGNYNTLLGCESGDALVSNSYVTAVGHQSLLLGTGAKNTALGAFAGDNIVAGASNIMIGYDVEASSDSASNELNIGSAIYGTGILGGTVKIGIADQTPSYTLDVGGDLGVQGAQYNSPTINEVDTDTSGHYRWSQPLRGSGWKKVLIYLDNTTDAGGEVITYSTAFTYTPAIAANSTGLTIATLSNSAITIPASSAVTGWIILEGF